MMWSAVFFRHRPYAEALQCINDNFPKAEAVPLLFVSVLCPLKCLRVSEALVLSSGN